MGAAEAFQSQGEDIVKTEGGDLLAALPVGNVPARSELGSGKRSERA